MTTEHTSLSTQTEKGLFFWVFLGPLSLLMSLSLILTLNPTDFVLLPFVLLTGVGLLWNLRLQGLLASLAMLAVYAGYLIWDTDAENAGWFSGAMLAIASSYVITFLTLEEAKESVLAWRSKALKDTETLSDAANIASEQEQKLSVENTKALALIKELEDNENLIKAELQSLEKVQELSRLELLSTISKHDQAVEELSDLRHELSQIKEEVEEKNQVIETHKKLLVGLQSESVRNKEMSGLIDTLSREKDLLESTLSRIQAELEDKETGATKLHAEMTELKKQQDLRERDWHALEVEWQTKIESLYKEMTALEKDAATSKAQMEGRVGEMTAELAQERQVSTEVPPATESEYRRIFGMHKQLKEQFTEKSKQLDDARKELFTANEKANLLQLELEGMSREDSPELQKLTAEMQVLEVRTEMAEREVVKLEALVTSLLKE